MSRVIRAVVLGSCLLAFAPCALFAVTQGGYVVGAPSSHYERPITDAGPFKDRAIVFVHGIFGDANGTWTSDGGAYWPKLLLKASAFNDFDVYVVQYDSPKQGNTLTATDIVAQLDNRLTADGVFEKHREVVFVCHSLGGIIIQQFLLTFRERAKKVPFVYFFGVPNEGAQVARLGNLFSSDPLLKALFDGNENEYLQNQENEWRAAHFAIKRYCAYEKKKVKGIILVVDRQSGTRSCSELPIPINEDHIGMVKPNGARHDSYIALRNAILANPVSHKPSIERPSKKTKVSSAPGVPGAPLITMEISPSILPVYVPPRSVTSILQLHPYIGLTDTQDGLLKIANDTPREGCWPSKKEMGSQDPSGYETVYRVEIGNHSQRTLAGGEIVFRLKYNTGQKIGCMPPSGTLEDQKDIVLIPTLDPGKSFDFYAVNQSNLCVWLIPPDSGTVKMDGDDKESQVTLKLDKNPLYAAGAPVFHATTIRWEGIPTKPGGYGMIRSVSVPCEITSQESTPSPQSVKDPIHWLQESVPSDDKAWPFRILLTIRTDQEIENPKFRIVCDSACSFGRFDMGRDAVSGTNRQDDDRTVVAGIWGPFNPRTPITVILYGNAAFHVQTTERLY